MPSFEGVHALIIEDDTVSVEVLKQLLGRLDVRTSVIIGSPRTPEKLEEIDQPDVIFLDLEMPGFNGYQVLDILLQHPTFKDVPVVAYTTHVSHMNDARNAGFHSFLGKPLDRAEFADNLERILNGESVWEAM